MALDWPKTL